MVTQKKKTYLLIKSINLGKNGEKIQYVEFPSAKKNQKLNFR